MGAAAPLPGFVAAHPDKCVVLCLSSLYSLCVLFLYGNKQRGVLNVLNVHAEAKFFSYIYMNVYTIPIRIVGTQYKYKVLQCSVVSTATE